MSKIWWTKMEHTDDYIAHYSMLSDSEIVADVRRSIASFANHSPDGDDFGAKMVRKALGRINERHEQAVEAGTLGGKAKAQKAITAAATTREGVDVVSNRESGSLARTTGCKQLTADASTREGEDERLHPSNGKLLESRTSANHYNDQETQISANSPAGAGVNLDSTHTNKSPDASDCKAEGVDQNGPTITRNESRAACTFAPSGQTIEALEQLGEGSISPEVGCQTSSLPSPISKPKTDPKPIKKKAEPEGEPKFPHGEFENIMLTTKEYIQLCERLDNADSLIDEADQYFEAQPDKKKKYKSHYAMLLNWDRRRKEVETPSRVRRFKTINEINQENYEKALREIEAMCNPEAKAV